MAELTVVAIVVLCFVLGSLWDRNNFGSRQDVLQLFDRFFSESHRQASDYASHRTASKEGNELRVPPRRSSGICS